MPKEVLYIKLPELKKVEVKDYHLFESSWEYAVKPGMNLFIGVNGIGKTTSINLIIFGIVGLQDNIDKAYFQNRSKPNLEVNSSDSPITSRPTLKISFHLGEHKFIIERDILQNSICSFSLDGHIITPEDDENIDEYYIECLTRYSGIKSLEDIVFLLNYFLIRVEEGNYLLWDNRGGDQAKLTRLLINNSNFEQEYKSLARKVKDFDTQLRGTMDIKAQWVKRINLLESEREEILSERKEYQSEKELKSKLIDRLNNLEELKTIQQKGLKQIEHTKAILEERNALFHSESLKYEQDSEMLSSLENSLFTSIYSNEKVLTAVHKLKHYNRCIYCGKIPKSDVRSLILKSINQDCKCPICKSNIEHVKQEKPLDKPSIKKVEKLSKKISNQKEKIDSLYSEIQKNSHFLEEQLNHQKELSITMHKLAIEANDLKIQVANLQTNPEDKVTVVDSRIQTLQTEIDKYDEVIVPVKKKYEKALRSLQRKNEIQEKILEEFQDEINTIFTKYASLYFRENCKLVTTSKKPKDSNVKVQSFVPEIDGSVRWAINNISTAERVLLEYLFRISLLELYHKKSGNKGFIILETSDGSFDISNTKQVAHAFTQFSKNKLPFILVVNFSKKDFLNELASGLGSAKKKRVLNYINFGRLTTNQQEDLPVYKRIMTEIGLE